MLNFLKINKKDSNLLLNSFLISSLIFSSIPIVYAASGTATPSLTATVAATLTFSATTPASVTITAGGGAVFSSSTLNVNTNNMTGWNVTLYGTDQSPTDTVMDSDDDASVGITDQLEWTAGSATTSGGTAVKISSLDNTQNVLAFRVMSASSTNSGGFWSTGWWGSADDYADNVNTKWAGIASSTNVTQIGNTGSGNYSATDHLNTVLFYFKVASTQQGGGYAGGLYFTAASN